MSTDQSRPGGGVVITHTRAHVDIHDALADLTFADAVQQARHALGVQPASTSDPAPEAEVAS